MAHAKHQEKDFVKECLSKGNGCTDHYKSKSLFVELPCKVGDKVYLLMGSTTPIEAFVMSVEFFYNWVSKNIETHLDLRIFKNFPVHKRVEDFGKTVFLTKEEAEQKLKELENGK
jgi:hypothetical protein